jgi:hypothetical protein
MNEDGSGVGGWSLMVIPNDPPAFPATSDGFGTPTASWYSFPLPAVRNPNPAKEGVAFPFQDTGGVPGHVNVPDNSPKLVLLSAGPHPTENGELALDVMSNVKPSHTTSKKVNREASGAVLS